MGRLDELKSSIMAQAEPICAEIGIEIVEINLHAHHENLAIQIFADLPAGGIGIEECTALNHRLDKILYNELNLGDNYTLEVSSPGLDRMLVGYKDLRRVIGRPIQIFLKEPVEGRREVSGVLKAARETDIIVDVRKEEWTIPMNKIEKSKQIII